MILANSNSVVRNCSGMLVSFFVFFDLSTVCGHFDTIPARFSLILTPSGVLLHVSSLLFQAFRVQDGNYWMEGSDSSTWSKANICSSLTFLSGLHGLTALRGKREGDLRLAPCLHIPELRIEKKKTTFGS